MGQAAELANGVMGLKAVLLSVGTRLIPQRPKSVLETVKPAELLLALELESPRRHETVTSLSVELAAGVVMVL